MDKKPNTKLEIRANGPAVISGPIEVHFSNGDIQILERVVLCRCGESGKMPLCDASHNRVGFCGD